MIKAVVGHYMLFIWQNLEHMRNNLIITPCVPGGQHGAHLGPVGPRLAPCWPHEPCYQGCWSSSQKGSVAALSHRWADDIVGKSDTGVIRALPKEISLNMKRNEHLNQTLMWFYRVYIWQCAEMGQIRINVLGNASIFHFINLRYIITFIA